MDVPTARRGNLRPWILLKCALGTAPWARGLSEGVVWTEPLWHSLCLPLAAPDTHSWALSEEGADVIVGNSQSCSA